MYDENLNGYAASTTTPSSLSGSAAGGSQAAAQAYSSNVMAMLNHLMNVKDSRWLQLEVCREFQRGQCSRTDLECKFAHPPPHVDVQNGKVTACYDSIKSRCTRENPKCKYLHPPQHLKDQLLINGRNTLALKNMIVQQIANPALSTPGAQANNNMIATQQLLAQQAALQSAIQYPAYGNAAFGQLGNASIYQTMMPGLPNPNDALTLQTQLAAMQQQATTSPAYGSTGSMSANGSISSTKSRSSEHPKVEVKSQYKDLMDNTVNGNVAQAAQYQQAASYLASAPPKTVPESRKRQYEQVGQQLEAQQGVQKSALLAAQQVAALAYQQQQLTMAPYQMGDEAAHAQMLLTALQQQQQAAQLVQQQQLHLQQLHQPSAAKRAALDKNGLPVYQPQVSLAALQQQHLLQYPQAMSLPLAQFNYAMPSTMAFAGQPPGVPRF